MATTVRLMLLAVALCSAVRSEPMINLSHIGQGGVISSQGLGQVITGSAVRISTLLGIGVSANDNAQLNVGGNAGGYASLDFVTGVLKSVTNIGYGIWEYVYDGGGSFTVRGNVAAAGITGDQVLLSGSFYDGKLTVQDTGAGYVVLMQATGTDAKHASLLNFFGLPNAQFSFAGFSIAAALVGEIAAPGAFSAVVHSTSITNTVVPEPGTLLLMGTAMIACSAGIRARRKVGGPA